MQKSYLFDVTLKVALRVNASSEAEARKILEESLDCADANFGSFSDGSPILGEASLTGEPPVFVNESVLTD